jgi:hypothetical protein
VPVCELAHAIFIQACDRLVTSSVIGLNGFGFEDPSFELSDVFPELFGFFQVPRVFFIKVKFIVSVYGFDEVVDYGIPRFPGRVIPSPFISHHRKEPTEF